MSSFDESKVRRGQPSNRGGFNNKEHSVPLDGLTDRPERLRRAAELTGELSTARRKRDDERADELVREIAQLQVRETRQAPPLVRQNLDPRNRPASEYLVGDGREENYDLDPPYQRGAVWSAQQRQRLIESLLRGIPIGNVTINSRWESNGYKGEIGYAVVDGKQRIETIRLFADDKLAVPADWFEDADVETENDDGTVTFAGLSLRGRRMVENWQVPTLVANVPTIVDEARLFLLINSGGTAQQDEDLDRARAIAGY